jgi:putative exosortase-associated protein (TIGR04073 family)
MHKLILPLAAVAVAVFATGCAGPEQKLGRGLSNSYEVVRWGELRRSVEQNATEPLVGTGYFGIIHGFDRSVTRAGIGLFETVTFPFPTPTYAPSFKNFYETDPSGEALVDPVFPRSYAPGLISDPMFDTDTYTGFSGSDVVPFIPGSRFSVFNN